MWCSPSRGGRAGSSLVSDNWTVSSRRVSLGLPARVTQTDVDASPPSSTEDSRAQTFSASASLAHSWRPHKEIWLGGSGAHGWSMECTLAAPSVPHSRATHRFPTTRLPFTARPPFTAVRPPFTARPPFTPTRRPARLPPAARPSASQDHSRP